MLTAIILVIVLLFITVFLGALSEGNRKSIVNLVINIVTLGGAYLFKVLARAIRLTMNAGKTSAYTIEIEGEEVLKSIDSCNKTIKDNGGAVRIALKACKSHGETLGLNDLYDYTAKVCKEKKEQLDKLRSARDKLIK